MNKLDTMLFRMIKQSKGQFIAVLVIIMVGIAIFTALAMASTNLENTKDDYYKESGFADLFAQGSHIPSSAIARLENIKGLSAAEGRIVLDVPFITDDDSRVNVKLMTSRGQEQRINRLTVSRGRQIRDPAGEALVYQPFAEARGIKPGDTIRVQISGVRYALSVCGLVQSPEFIYLTEGEQSLMPNPSKYGVVYVSETLAQQALSMPGAYNEAVFLYDKDGQGRVRGSVSEDDLIDKVEDVLDNYGLTRTIKAKDQLSNNMVSQEITQLKNACLALPVLFLLVAALVLMMMLSRMVKRDRIIIGVLKAIGFSNARVMLHYVKYSIIAGFLGGILGIVLGVAVADYMTGIYISLFSMPSYGTKYYYVYYAAAILLSCGFSAVSGICGAKESLHVVPAESMQSEAPKAGRRIYLENFSGLWKRLSFSRKMIAKNIFRNKKRSVFILMGVALTYGMMLFTLTMPQVIDDVMRKHFSEFQRMDYNASFYRPVEGRAAEALALELPDACIEGRIEYPFEFSKGSREKTAVIVGLKRDTQFYALKDLKGRPLRLEKGGVLLTQNLAGFLRVGRGDAVKVKSFLPGKDDTTLTVTGIVKQSLGMNAYMELSDMGRRLFEPNAINGVYVDSQNPQAVEIMQRADGISSILSTEEMRRAYQQFLGLIILSVTWMIILSGILGFCIVYNATIVSLGEREMEFSSLRVLGFSREEIFSMILAENAWLSLAGILAGIPIGFFMCGYSSAVFSTDLYTFYITPTLPAAVGALLLASLFLLLSQGAAHHKIHGLDFLQALKNRAA